MKQSLLAFTILVVLVFMFSSCLPRRRWYSTFIDSKGNVKTEHYNQYKLRWYKKNWYNRQLWK